MKTGRLGDAGTFDMAPPEQAEGIQWGRYVAALRRYKWLMLLIVLLGTGIGVGITQFVDPEYMARSTIYVNDQPGGAKSGPIQTGELVQGQGWVELLRSFQVFDSVALKEQAFIEPQSASDSAVFRGLRLDRRYTVAKFELKISPDGKQYSLTTSEGIDLDRGAVGDSIGRRAGFLWQPSPAGARSRPHDQVQGHQFPRRSVGDPEPLHQRNGGEGKLSAPQLFGPRPEQGGAHPERDRQPVRLPGGRTQVPPAGGTDPHPEGPARHRVSPVAGSGIQAGELQDPGHHRAHGPDRHFPGTGSRPRPRS